MELWLVDVYFFLEYHFQKSPLSGVWDEIKMQARTSNKRQDEDSKRSKIIFSFICKDR